MQPQDDPSLLRALAERLAQAPLHIGSLPPELPVELPLPPGARVLGSVMHPAIRHPMMPDHEIHLGRTQIWIDAPGSASELIAHYAGALRDQAWQVHQSFRPTTPPSGAPFPLAMPESLTANGPEDRQIQIAIRPVADQVSSILITFSSLMRHMRTRQMGLMGVLDRVLRMGRSAGISIWPHGGHGSDGEASVEAVAEGDLTAAAVEAQIAERCLAEGWSRRDGGADGPVAWSRWHIPDEGGLDGSLTVTEEPGGRRAAIVLRARRASDVRRSGASSHPFSTTFSSWGTMILGARDDEAAGAGQPGGARPWPADGASIACPRCGWRPSASSVWSCGPECGTVWNTFNTRGRCPGCGRRWTETACLSCGGLSPHEDWYRSPEETSGS